MNAISYEDGDDDDDDDDTFGKTKGFRLTIIGVLSKGKNQN